MNQEKSSENKSQQVPSFLLQQLRLFPLTWLSKVRNEVVLAEG